MMSVSFNFPSVIDHKLFEAACREGSFPAGHEVFQIEKLLQEGIDWC